MVLYLPGDDQRLERLRQRHIDFGKTPEQADAWIAAVDEPNAATHRGDRRAGRRHPRLKARRLSPVPTIVVEVMPKAELLDPAGKAVAGALNRLGKSEFTAVRIGKRFELTVDGEVTDAVLAEARALADDMLSNTVIEDVVVGARTV